MSHPITQLYPQLAHVVSCGWWRVVSPHGPTITICCGWLVLEFLTIYRLQIFLRLQTRMEWILGGLGCKIAIGGVYTPNARALIKP